MPIYQLDTRKWCYMEELTEQFQSDSRRRKTDMKGINAGTQRQQKSYMPFEQNSSHIYMGQKQKQNSNALFSKKDMRDIRRSVQTSWSELAGAPSGKTGNTQSYGESLRAQRQQAKDTSLSLKKLKYQFKSLSTKILRSKTSLAARQAAGQARREILRLKSQKQSGKYDNEELEAAIEHAKAMERVAKKKARHLEEEEMAKCTGGPCAGSRIEEEQLSDEETKAMEENPDDALKHADEPELVQGQEETDKMAAPDPAMLQNYANCWSALESMEDVLSSLDEFSDEILKEFSESMKELFDEMGLDELSDSILSVEKDMDPADLKMMKIKHRNKEMKDIVRADAKYLKTVFDHLEKTRSEGTVVPDNSGAVTFGSSGQEAAPVINIVL